MKKKLLIPLLALAATPAFGVITTFTANDDSLIIGGGGADPDGNFGGRTELINGDTAGQGRHMIMRWDVSSLTGLVGTVNSITIELDLSSTRAAPTLAQTSTVQLISETDKGWVEGTGNNNLPPNDGVTWNNASVGPNVAWSGGAGLAGSTTIANIGTLSILGSESQGQTVSVTLSGTDLKLMLAGWADDGAMSSGVLFRDDAATSSQQIFYNSAETGGATSAPRLIVNYEPIPEPSSSLLGLGALSVLFLRRRR